MKVTRGSGASWGDAWPQIRQKRHEQHRGWGCWRIGPVHSSSSCPPVPTDERRVRGAAHQQRHPRRVGPRGDAPPVAAGEADVPDAPQVPFIHSERNQNGNAAANHKVLRNKNSNRGNSIGRMACNAYLNGARSPGKKTAENGSGVQYAATWPEQNRIPNSGLKKIVTLPTYLPTPGKLSCPRTCQEGLRHRPTCQYRRS